MIATSCALIYASGYDNDKYGFKTTNKLLCSSLTHDLNIYVQASNCTQSHSLALGPSAPSPIANLFYHIRWVGCIQTAC